MAYGVTSTGFSKKTLAVIKAEWEDAFRTKFGKSVNLQPPSLMATIIGIASEREAEVWDAAAECWNARGASTAQGVSLDNVGELTAEERIGAAPSKILDQIFFGDVGTIIGTDFIASVSTNAAAKFSPIAEVTLGSGTNAVQKLSFNHSPTGGTWSITMPDNQIAGPLGYNADATAIQIVIRLLTGWDGVTVSGDYSVGFTLTFIDGSVVGYAGLQPQDPVTGTSLLTYGGGAVVISQSDTTVGVAQATATLESLDDGPVVADSGTLSTIDTPVSGLNATKNLSDASLGRLVETDAEYRLRRESELQKSSSATVEAIRIRVKKVTDVIECIVYENTTLSPDGDGVPAKAVHIYVEGGSNSDVAQAIWNAVGGGIETYGSVVVTITDSQGLSQTVSFDRPTEKPVYVTVTITPDSDYPADGDTLVKEAIANYGDALKIGEDVLLRPKLLPAIVDNVPGIVDIVITIGFTSSPVGTANLTLAANQIATFDTSNMVVTS